MRILFMRQSEIVWFELRAYINFKSVVDDQIEERTKNQTTERVARTSLVWLVENTLKIHCVESNAHVHALQATFLETRHTGKCNLQRTLEAIVSSTTST